MNECRVWDERLEEGREFQIVDAAVYGMNSIQILHLFHNLDSVVSQLKAKFHYAILLANQPASWFASRIA